jgi:hypothetical protein
MRMQKFSRPGVILMATVVAVITSMVVANAAQTFTTPNSVNISFSLAAGANSRPITPIASRSVLVMGCTTTNGYQGVGQVSLFHIPSGGNNNGMIWVGLESYFGAAITSGNNNGVGDHIVYIANGHQVDIQVASADTIRVHNGSAATQTGNVTLVW